jgi:hypothetical protein
VSFRLVRHVAFALLCSSSVLAQSEARTFWEVAVPLSTVKAWEGGKATLGGSLVAGLRTTAHTELGAMAEWQGVPIGCFLACGQIVSVDGTSRDLGYSQVERVGVLSRVFVRSHPRLSGLFATVSAAMMHGTWNDATRPSTTTPAFSVGVGVRGSGTYSIDVEWVGWRNASAGLQRGFFEISSRWRLP